MQFRQLRAAAKCASCVWLLLVAFRAFAQDALLADPHHFQLEYEDDKVRVLRFTLPPGETSPMHDHAEGVAVVVRSAKVRITSAAGLREEPSVPAGTVQHRSAGRDSAQNIDTVAYETVITEFKYALAAEAIRQKQTPSAAVTGTKPNNVATVTRESQPVISQKPKVIAAAPAPAPIAATQPPPQKQAEPAPPQPQQQAAVAPTLDEDSAFARPQKIVGSKSTTVNGVELAYVERGQGQAVILVHGALADLRSWSRQMDALAQRFHVVAYSRRYHYPNPSTGKERDYTYQVHADDLSALIRKLDLGRVHLVAQSWGAAVAGMVAAQHPELVRSLVLIEPPFEEFLPSLRAEGAKYSRIEIMNIIRKAMGKQHSPERGLQLFADWGGGSGSWDKLTPEQQQRRRENQNSLQDMSLFAETPKFSCADAKKISAPTLIVHSEGAAPNNLEITARLAECIPGAQGMAGSTAADAAESFNRSVMGFLEKNSR